VLILSGTGYEEERDAASRRGRGRHVTDLFAWDPEAPDAGRVRQAKVLSTPEDPSVGFMRALEVAGIEAAEIAAVVHGTTIATNALIERRYPARAGHDPGLPRRTRDRPPAAQAPVRPLQAHELTT
jgi:N-methylhydantoinase A/oxoprolinase/acetone carboxylase beta subunit